MLPFATFIRDIETNHEDVSQKLFAVEPPLDGHSYVVVSASKVTQSALANLASGLSDPDLGISLIETYIFASNETGDIKSSTELTGSQKGTLDHNKVLNDLGYAVLDTSYFYCEAPQEHNQLVNLIEQKQKFDLI